VTIGDTIYIPAGGTPKWRDGADKQESIVHPEVAYWLEPMPRDAAVNYCPFADHFLTLFR
jgi:hypothetical protein